MIQLLVLTNGRDIFLLHNSAYPISDVGVFKKTKNNIELGKAENLIE